MLGPNGGGKSTLFRALLGELEPLAGGSRAAGGFGYVPQTERSRLDYPVSALDVALMGTLSRLPWWRRPGRARARGSRSRRSPASASAAARRTQFGELSGGQRQRVLVARALVQDAPILLLDEPFTGVDQPSAELLEQLLGELAGEGRGILIATHDVDQARRLGQRALPEPAPDRVRPARRRRSTADVLEQTYGGAIVAIPGEGGAALGILPRPPSPPRRRADAARARRTVDARLHAARLPRARARRGRRRRARLLGRLLRALLQRRVARARALPGARRGRAARGAARRSAARWACSCGRGRRRASGGRREIGRDTSVARRRSRPCSGSGSCSRSRPRRRPG